MGSTRIDAPQIDPINVAQQIKDTSRAYRQATPDIIAAERELRGPMQQLALQDAQTALMGGVTPGMLRDRDAAEQQLQTAQRGRASAEQDIQGDIDRLSSKGDTYDDSAELARLRNLKDEYADALASDSENEKLKKALQTVRVELGEDVPDFHGTGNVGKGFTPERRQERFGNSQKERDAQEVENLASSLQSLKESGDLSDDAIATLEGNFNAAADSVLDANPGMLELSRRAVESQARVGRRLKDAAAKGEFQTISELAPDLVDLYRKSDPGSQNLADIASERAEQLSTQSPSEAQKSFNTLATSLSERGDPTTQAQAGVGAAREGLQAAGANLGAAQTGLASLAETVGQRVPGGDLGTAAREGIQALLGGAAMGQTGDQQTVAQQIGQLLQGPQAGAAEQRLLDVAGQGPSAAEQQLLQAAGGPASAEAQALGQFGQQALQGGQRAASGVEQALQQQALQQLGFQAAGASPEEQAIQQRIGGLVADAGTLSSAQRRQGEQEGLALGVKQGRVRDLSTVANVQDRLAEARKADEVQDLMTAQQLIGQQQAMQQSRTAEELQRMGMGGQFAGQSEALAQGRLAEERALQQMGVGAAGTAAGLQAQQAGLQQQALQAAGGMAGQRAGQAQQALGAAGSLEQSRLSQQLQGTGLAQNIAQAGFASDMAGREQQLRELGMGSQEAARFAQQQAQQDAMQGQIIGQQAGLAGQQAAFAGQEASLAGQQFAQQAGIEQQQFQQQAQRDSALASLFGQQAGMEQQQFAQQQAGLGQAFQMQRAMGPDVGAFFGRPASQAEGLQVLGMGQQQAQYGTTPQATDPMLGVNMALQQQANQAGLDAAAMSASAQAQGGLMSGIGSIAGAALGGPVGGFGSALGGALFGKNPPCWVAREVYGQNNPMWLLFRGWLFDEAPSWFRKIYIKHGERFAEFISNKPFIKSFIRKWMTSIVKKHYK